jgi:hypothetical protein
MNVNLYVLYQHLEVLGESRQHWYIAELSLLLLADNPHDLGL